MFSITSLSPCFFLQSSVVPQSTVRLSILGPSSPELTSSTVQDIQSVSSSINIYPKNILELNVITSVVFIVAWEPIINKLFNINEDVSAEAITVEGIYVLIDVTFIS
jgi:hypothetical protein